MSKGIQSFQFIFTGQQYKEVIQKVLNKGSKGRYLNLKRASFASQKGVICKRFGGL